MQTNFILKNKFLIDSKSGLFKSPFFLIAVKVMTITDKN